MNADLLLQAMEGAGIGCWEYPGYLGVDLVNYGARGAGSLNIGTANGPIDADLVDVEGHHVRSYRYEGALEAEPLKEWLKATIDQACEDLESEHIDDEKRSNGRSYATGPVEASEFAVLAAPAVLALWVCSECGHEVMQAQRPEPMRWSDGHVCRFQEGGVQ